MRRVLALMVALSLMMVFGGVAFAGGGFGECSYSTHAKQVAADKTDTAKPVATQKAPETDADKLVLAQKASPDKPAAPTNK
jgi:hypothetical protein